MIEFAEGQTETGKASPPCCSKENWDVSLQAALMLDIETLSTSLVDQFQKEADTFFVTLPSHMKLEQNLEAFLFSGLTTEAAEVVDIYKKDILWKNSELPPQAHFVEELGDVMWHVATLCSYYGISMAYVMAEGMKKFRNKYPGRFLSEGGSELCG